MEKVFYELIRKSVLIQPAAGLCKVRIIWPLRRPAGSPRLAPGGIHFVLVYESYSSHWKDCIHIFEFKLQNRYINELFSSTNREHDILFQTTIGFFRKIGSFLHVLPPVSLPGYWKEC